MGKFILVLVFTASPYHSDTSTTTMYSIEFDSLAACQSAQKPITDLARTHRNTRSAGLVWSAVDYVCIPKGAVTPAK